MIHVDVQVVLPYLNFHCPVLKNMGESGEYMRKNWIFFSSTDTDFLQGFLLAACRHLSMVNLDGDYAQFAIQYKLRYIQSLRQAISSDNPSSCRIAVTKALVLTLDEVRLKSRLALMLPQAETLEAKQRTDSFYLDYARRSFNGLKTYCSGCQYHPNVRGVASSRFE